MLNAASRTPCYCGKTFKNSQALMQHIRDSPGHPQQTMLTPLSYHTLNDNLQRPGEATRLRNLWERCVLHLVPGGFESALLKDSHPWSSNDSGSILNRITALDKKTGRLFQLKEQSVSQAPLRLLMEASPCRSDCREPRLEKRLAGFIALSYCWRNPSWVPVSGFEACDSHGKSLPVARSILQTALALRTESAEGVEGLWIDSLCINQEDRQEKMRAIASMDRIFKSARLVVIALEDIEISNIEAAVIEQLKASKPSLDRNKDEEGSFESVTRLNAATVWGLVANIGSARWFERAWCAHEFHLCQNAIFVIPRVGGTTITLSLSALERILICKTNWTSSSQTDTETSLQQYSRLVLLLTSRFIHSGGFTQSRPVMGICYQTQTLNATKFNDKISIALNLLGLGLYFDGDVKSHTHCRYIFSILAVAASDSVALCSTGPRLGNACRKKSTNYIRWPQLSDLVHLNDRYPHTFHGWGETIMFRPKGLTIDVYFLNDVIRRPSDAHRKQAKAFLEACWNQYSYIFQKIQPEQWTMPHFDRTTFVEYGTTYIACALDLGYAWIATSLEGICCTPVPRGLRDYSEELFSPLWDVIEEHLLPSLEEKSCNSNSKGSQKKLLDYFIFAFHHIPLLAAAGRDIPFLVPSLRHAWARDEELPAKEIAILQSDDVGGSAMITVPRVCHSLSTTFCLPIALAETTQSFAKRFWLLKRIKGTKGTLYRVLDKGYLWGLYNPTQRVIWRKERITIVR